MKKAKLNTVKAAKAVKGTAANAAKPNKRKLSKAEEAKRAKEAERKKAERKAAIAAKAVELDCSKGYAAILLTIETLEAKDNKSQHDFVRLANARLKVEFRKFIRP